MYAGISTSATADFSGLTEDFLKGLFNDGLHPQGIVLLLPPVVTASPITDFQKVPQATLSR